MHRCINYVSTLALVPCSSHVVPALARLVLSSHSASIGQPVNPYLVTLRDRRVPARPRCPQPHIHRPMWFGASLQLCMSRVSINPVLCLLVELGCVGSMQRSVLTSAVTNRQSHTLIVNANRQSHGSSVCTRLTQRINAIDLVATLFGPYL